MTQEDRVQLRHTDRWVGVVVLLALLLFLGALFQRSVLREWFAGGDTLTVLLPEEGVAGLSEGSEAEVLGIRAGTVRRVVIEPQGRIRAELRVEDQAKVFIRQDSSAVIRRRFGVAGPAYIDIARGEGAPLDWENGAIIEAKSERAPTETVGALLDEVQRRVFPVLDDLQRGMRAFAETTERLARGEGTVGRLLTDETIAREAEEATRRTTAILSTIETASQDVQRLTATLSGPETATNGGNGRRGRGAPAPPPPGTLPSLLLRADRTLAALEQASRDLARASPALPQAARNVREGTEPLPAVVVQAQETARELELLLNQLRGHWLLSSGGAEPSSRAAPRPAADRVRP